MENDTCPVCEHDNVAREVEFDERKYSLRLSCPNCGTFYLTRNAVDGLPSLPPDTRRKIQRFLYETRDEADLLLTPTPLPSEGWAGRMLSFESAGKLYEDDGSPLEKYDDTLRRIAHEARTFGRAFCFPEDRWIVPTMDDEEAERILNALTDEGYLSADPAMGEIGPFSLTPQGLRYASELATEARTDSTSVFIAACFSDELKEARDTIHGVIEALGFKPRQVNREPHNELIDLKIYQLIRESCFVVADLTCNRQSVYYEVGFAHGLGLEVVLTCRSDHMTDTEDEFKHVHFDLSHRNILEWASPEELRKKLSDHIYQAFGALSTGIVE